MANNFYFLMLFRFTIFVYDMCNLSLVVSTSRPIEIEIENVLCVETNFWKPSRFSRRSRLTFFWRRDRDLDKNRDFRASRPIETSSRLCLDSRDQFLKPVEIFSTVEINFYKCRDRESRSRPCRDKSRPPGLVQPLY